MASAFRVDVTIKNDTDDTVWVDGSSHCGASYVSFHDTPIEAHKPVSGHFLIDTGCRSGVGKWSNWVIINSSSTPNKSPVITGYRFCYRTANESEEAWCDCYGNSPYKLKCEYTRPPGVHRQLTLTIYK
jgi:hypothetical protein